MTSMTVNHTAACFQDVWMVCVFSTSSTCQASQDLKLPDPPFFTLARQA